MADASSVFDRIFASRPVNKTAGAVTSSRGDALLEKIPKTQQHWKAPPPWRCPSVAEIACPSFADLTGRTLGRLRVIGILDAAKANVPRSSTDSKQRWVVRCICGDYELRSAKAIKSQQDEDACCCLCAHLKVLRKRETRKAFGLAKPVTVEDAVSRIRGTDQ